MSLATNTTDTSGTGTPTITAPPSSTCNGVTRCVEISTYEGSAAPVAMPVRYLRPDTALKSALTSPQELKMGKYIEGFLYITGIANLADTQRGNEFEVDVIKIFPGSGDFVTGPEARPPYAFTLKTSLGSLETKDSMLLDRQTNLVVDSISTYSVADPRGVVIKGTIVVGAKPTSGNAHTFIVSQYPRIGDGEPSESRARLLNDLSGTRLSRLNHVQELVFNPSSKQTSPLYVIGYMPPILEEDPSFGGASALGYNDFIDVEDGVNIDADTSGRELLDILVPSRPEKIISLTEDHKASRFFFLTQESDPIDPQKFSYKLYQANNIGPSGPQNRLGVMRNEVKTPSLGQDMDDSCKGIQNLGRPQLDTYIANYKRRDNGLVKHHPQALRSGEDGSISYVTPYLYKPGTEKWLILLQASEDASLKRATCFALPPDDDVIAYTLQDPSDPSSYVILSARSEQKVLTLHLPPSQGCGGICAAKTVEYTFASHAVVGAYPLGIGQGFVVALSDEKAIFYIHIDDKGELTNKLRSVAEETKGPVSFTPPPL